MKKIINIVVKYIQLISQGERFRDRFIIACYFAKTPVHLVKRILNVKYSHKLIGNVTVKSKDGIFFCGDNIFTVWTGSSFHELEIRKYFDIKEGTFIDIGANIGKFSIIVGRRLGNKGNVISIEPHPQNFKSLRRNIELNRLKNVKALNIACSSSEGFLDLFIDEEGTGGHSTIRSKDSKAGDKKIAVKTRELDSIIHELGVKKVNLIKVDVEGAESLVLEGARKLLKRDHPKIIFEAWNRDYYKKVEDILKDFGYRFKKIDEDNYLAH